MNRELYKTSLVSGQDPKTVDSTSVCRNASSACVFSVPISAKPGRLDAFLGNVLREDGFSREKIKQAILAGNVTLNRLVCKKPNTQVAPGDELAALLVPPVTTITAEEGELSILWHDEHLAVLNKPAGLTVHPAPGRPEGTLAHRLLHHFPDLAAQGGLRPGIVHRLDKNTSGLMLVALTEKVRLALCEAFAERNVHKEYLALVHGVPRKTTDSITKPIGRSPVNKTKMAVVSLSNGGKEAKSDFTVLFADPAKRYSLVKVVIHTGRTHQIRVHMQDMGHALLGDSTYKTHGAPAVPRNTALRQMLHAWRLAFTHPETGEKLAFCLEPPADFTEVATAIACPMQRVIVTGSPGGGKSTLTRALHATHISTWSADECVKRLYELGGSGWYLLRQKFGGKFVPDEKAGVDKRALFAAMTQSETIRREVEILIHPLVREDLATFWQEREEAGEQVAAAEIPLYLESAWYNKKNTTQSTARELIVGTYAPFAKRRERMKATRNWSDETIAALESWQWSEDKKIRAADIVVSNSGSLEDLLRQSHALVRVLDFLRRQTEKRTRTALITLWE